MTRKNDKYALHSKKMSKALNEAKETLDSLIGDFVTGELVGERLRKQLLHIKKQIMIVENL
tara:strand:+ start:402 stop:584 length:183 start_codon:yes stop_codon:yes gene_type:complete